MQLHALALFLVALMAQGACGSWVWIPNHLERFAPSEIDSSAHENAGLQRMTRSDGAAFGEGIPPRAVRYQRTGGAILLGRR
ncbi:hypothetical protein PENTCL1PPCAC_18694 [Pristionchus entomophagus]|uniref:Uncharacterized protein n=1 Tax=Pristionchus entomophagus TaxID=358040 RepID=A0AAV5TR83_9BILA|nr:hypothetical protein PENTCL1PPCAC_18694 [Pristionchus entomophagus]